MNRSLLGLAICFLGLGLPAFAQPVKLELKKNDRICFVGETLAEREVQFGYFEAILQGQLADKNLSFRNLAFSGDTPTYLLEDLAKGEARIRALNFGGIHKYLKENKADVIFLFFGQNDSFQGDKGLDSYITSLQDLIYAYKNQKFNGSSPPRLVIVSPIAHEKLGGLFRDPAEHNRQLQKYTEAMRKLAQDQKIPFIDLFTPSLALMDEPGGAPLTFNGIHLTQYGHWAMSFFFGDSLGLTSKSSAIEGLVLARKADPKRPSWIVTSGETIDYRVPPPPAGARVHPSLLKRLPILTVPRLPEGHYGVVLDGQTWRGTSAEDLAKGISFFTSPWQERGEILRRAILDRNTEFFYLWRAVNGEYIYGRRAKPFGVVNFPGEMDLLRRICDELDRNIQKANQPAKVESIAIQDRLESLAVRPIRVPERKPSDIASIYRQKQGVIGGKELPTAKTPEEAIKYFKLPAGYEINLFASERDFPLHNPLAIAFDAKGRLWVTTMPSYPHYLPGTPPDDKILILEDTKGVGKADKCTIFADRLYLPTGIEFGQGGVYVGAQPNLVHLKNDNDQVTKRETILHGMGTGDSHHAVHAFQWTPEGSLLLHEGIFHRLNTETPYGVLRNRDAGIYRFDPRDHKLETYVGYDFANPWGQVFNKWGQNFIADASPGYNYFGLPLTSHVGYPNHLPTLKVFTSVVRPTCGCELVSSRQFPPEAQGNFLVNNNIGFQGIKQHRVIEEGSGFTSKELEPLLFSTDPNFRPVCIQFGPDGALYIVDWFNPLIGHMQFSLRDPGRDHYHGRIWRITYKGRPTVNAPVIGGQPIEKLLELLHEPEDRTRYRVRAELRERDPKVVRAALDAWVKKLDEGDAEYERLLLEALWLYQSFHFVDEKLLTRLLFAKDYNARAAATRALRHYREQFPAEQALKFYEGQINDIHPRVRLEAVVALSYYDDARAAEIVQDVFNHPTDYYLDYAIGNTLKALEPKWKPALQAGMFKVRNAGAANYLLASVSTQELIAMPRTEPVYLALLSRANILPKFRTEALEGLAMLHRTDLLTELFAAMERGDRGDHGASHDVLHDLGHLLTMQSAEELNKLRPRLEKLARAGHSALSRQLAYVALVAADRSLDRVWASASQNPRSLVDVVESLGLVPDVTVRKSAFPKVQELLSGLPKELEEKFKGIRGLQGRFVRIDLPGNKRTLTLAELEVYSGGGNIARLGKAKQSSTAFGGDASRAIDGNKSALFADGGQTHTQEMTKNPWWELDLGSERPIESIVIYNRAEGFIGRLEGFKLSILDGQRKPIVELLNNSAPSLSKTFAFESNPVDALRLAAIKAIVTIPDFEAESFAALAKFIREGKDRDASVQAVQKLPKAKWPKDQIKPLATLLLEQVNRVPANQRGELQTLDAIQLGQDLAGVLGPEGADLAAQFGKLSVQVVRIATIPHNTAFDVAEFYVEAGKPVIIVFDNYDIMPHNLVIGAPGSLTEIGQLAEKMAQDTTAFAKGFVPKTPKVLFATRLLQPREVDRLNLTAPKEPGKYVFVCTFPGHWPIMNGIVHVVPDLAKIPTTDRVKPLEDKKWTLDMLAGDVDQLHGRSLERGRDLFKLRTCQQCHKMNGEGGPIGPDLTVLRKKLEAKEITRTDLLSEILEPSKKIEPKFKLVRFILDSGRAIDGIILHEDKDIVRIAKNQVEPPLEIKKDSIETRVELKISLMPEGLLNRMNKEDILDLIAYLLSAGDAAHPAFRKE